jgi:hypothetical protein
VVVQGCPIYLYVSREAFQDEYAVTSCRLQYRSVIYMIEMKRAADFMNASTSHYKLSMRIIWVFQGRKKFLFAVWNALEDKKVHTDGRLLSRSAVFVTV